jgi:hypothetical protein
VNDHAYDDAASPTGDSQHQVFLLSRIILHLSDDGDDDDADADDADGEVADDDVIIKIKMLDDAHPDR